MNVKQLFVWTLCLFFAYLERYLVISISYKNRVFYRRSDKRLSYASSVRESRSAKDCVASCAMEAGCLYVSYNFASAQCEFSDKEPASATITLDDASGWNVYVRAGCETGWYGFNGSCYFLVQESTDWETAKVGKKNFRRISTTTTSTRGSITVYNHPPRADQRLMFLFNWKEIQKQLCHEKACESLGAHLIDIQTEDEFNFITGVISSDFSIGFYWIGANDIDQEGVFTWSDGSPVSVSFSPWAVGQPDNSGTKEHCVHLLNRFEWNDIECTDSTPWRICEK